jgi:outer membrane biosynthesis protein TonB
VSAGEIAAHLSKLVVQSNGRLTRCYEQATKALPADQPLSGNVDIGLAVLPTGAGSDVRVVNNTTGSDDLARCVLAIVQSWTYPPHDEGEPIQFMRPFHFGPQGP